MKALLLRVGIDKGTDGTLGPIFADGSFEFIPISEVDSRSREDRTYKNTIGRSGKPFSIYLPKSIENRKMHFDPEFDTFTYGDPTVKRRFLLKLKKDDLLVFYAGLVPYNNNLYEEALYIIGYFTVDRVVDFNALTQIEARKYYSLYPGNAHLKRKYDTEDLVIVTGEKNKSRLLQKAILISKRKLDRRGRPYHAVSSDKEELLGISGSIQRSIPPRVIRNEQYVTNLVQLLKLNTV